MIKNATIYKIPPYALEGLEHALSTMTFAPTRSVEEKSVGWVPPRGEEHGALVESNPHPIEGDQDPMYQQAVDVVLKNRKASISLVQRQLVIGYNRAARLLEDMEKQGVVSRMDSNGHRTVLRPA